jgi:hypothetical protein
MLLELISLSFRLNIYCNLRRHHAELPVSELKIKITFFTKQGRTYTNNDIIHLLQQSAIKYDNCHNPNECATEYALDMEKAVNLALGLEASDTFLSKIWEATLSTVPYIATFVAGGVTVYYCMQLQVPRIHLHNE